MPVTRQSELDTEFQRLHTVFTSSRFLKMEGLGNEVPFFIWTFDPGLQNQVDKHIDALVRRLRNDGLNVLVFNLFDLSIDCLKGRDAFTGTLEIEPSVSKTKFLSHLKSVLDVEHTLVPAMKEKLEAESHDIVFMTGIGLVYPFIRSHNILNNVQRIFKEHPMVLFFPGEYRELPTGGSTLDLFGRMTDDNYYRAFDLNNYRV